jgi:hypothetical protein
MSSEASPGALDYSPEANYTYADWLEFDESVRAELINGTGCLMAPQQLFTRTYTGLSNSRNTLPQGAGILGGRP